MNVIAKSLIGIFLLFGFVYYAEGSARVMAKKRRQAEIAEIENLIARKQLEFSFQKVTNPFLEKEEVVEVAKTEIEAPAYNDPIEPGEKINPRELLTRVSRQIEPTGSIERQGQFFLLFGSDFISVGEPIKVRFEGKEYEIFVDSIDENKYLLRYKDEIVAKSIN